MNTEAFKQWSKRKEDEVFKDIGSMYDAVSSRRESSTTSKILLGDLRFDQGGGGQYLEVETEQGTKQLTPWAFEQLSTRLQSPSGFLSELPAPMAADILNHKTSIDNNREVPALTCSQGQTLRAVTGIQYGRVWDEEVVETVSDVLKHFPNFQNPYNGRGGPTGLYASDRDCFMFFIDPNRSYKLGDRANLQRGFFLWNSEVGSTSLGVRPFLFNTMCSNHMIMGFQDLGKLSIRHSKNVRKRFHDDLIPMLRQFCSGEPNFSGVERAMTLPLRNLLKIPNPIAMLPEEIFRSTQIKGAFTKGEITSGFNKAIEEEGQVETVWDFVMGLTAVARDLPHTNKRTNLESRAGRLVELSLLA